MRGSRACCIWLPSSSYRTRHPSRRCRHGPFSLVLWGAEQRKMRRSTAVPMAFVRTDDESPSEHIPSPIFSLHVATNGRLVAFGEIFFRHVWCHFCPAKDIGWSRCIFLLCFSPGKLHVMCVVSLWPYKDDIWFPLRTRSRNDDWQKFFLAPYWWQFFIFSNCVIIFTNEVIIMYMPNCFSFCFTSYAWILCVHEFGFNLYPCRQQFG